MHPPFLAGPPQDGPPRPINHEAVQYRLHARQFRRHVLAEGLIIPQLLRRYAPHNLLGAADQFVQFLLVTALHVVFPFAVYFRSLCWSWYRRVGS